MTQMAETPDPPYYAVIFSSRQTDNEEGYQEMGIRMVELAQKQPGYLGFEMAGGPEFGIAISYWESLEAIDQWRNHPEHVEAKTKGIADWYQSYNLRICRVDAALNFKK